MVRKPQYGTVMVREFFPRKIDADKHSRAFFRIVSSSSHVKPMIFMIPSHPSKVLRCPRDWHHTSQTLIVRCQQDRNSWSTRTRVHTRHNSLFLCWNSHLKPILSSLFYCPFSNMHVSNHALDSEVVSAYEHSSPDRRTFQQTRTPPNTRLLPTLLDYWTISIRMIPSISIRFCYDEYELHYIIRIYHCHCLVA